MLFNQSLGFCSYLRERNTINMLCDHMNFGLKMITADKVDNLAIILRRMQDYMLAVL